LRSFETANLLVAVDAAIAAWGKTQEWYSLTLEDLFVRIMQRMRITQRNRPI
jgi:hypothetical protein